MHWKIWLKFVSALSQIPKMCTFFQTFLTQIKAFTKLASGTVPRCYLRRDSLPACEYSSGIRLEKCKWTIPPISYIGNGIQRYDPHRGSQICHCTSNSIDRASVSFENRTRIFSSLLVAFLQSQLLKPHLLPFFSEKHSANGEKLLKN